MIKKFILLSISVTTAAILLIVLFKEPSSNAKYYDTETIEGIDVFQMDELLSPEIIQKDFHYTIDKILDVHPDPKRHIGVKWDELVKDTLAKLEDPLTIQEFSLILKRFISNLNDSHTAVYPSTVKSRHLPLSLTWTTEGFIVDTNYETYLQRGDKLVSIGNINIEDILDYMNEIISSENKYWVKEMTKNNLQDELFLTELSAVNRDDVTVTVERINGETKTIHVPFSSFTEDKEDT